MHLKALFLSSLTRVKRQTLVEWAKTQIYNHELWFVVWGKRNRCERERPGEDLFKIRWLKMISEELIFNLRPESTLKNISGKGPGCGKAPRQKSLKAFLCHFQGGFTFPGLVHPWYKTYLEQLKDFFAFIHLFFLFHGLSYLKCQCGLQCQGHEV